MMEKIKIGVLASGGGTNLQSIIDACESGLLKNLAEVSIVLSNNENAFALQRAKKHGIKAVFVDKKSLKDMDSFCDELINLLNENKVALVCLAGYLLKLSRIFVQKFKGRIMNIHPALLPKYGGKGMYGHHVHEAVIASGDKESGVTVHWVDEEYDHGNIIVQEKVPVDPNDTPETLAKKVLKVEHKIYIEAIEGFIKEINRCC
ncbi:phosphoribosylglycinamide formyltransferase [Elusimicrobiota bacterium]